MKQTVRKILVAGLSILAPAVLAESMVEARKDKVEVLGEPKKGAAALKTLSKGEKLPSSERKGMYWEVALGDKKGYVSVLDVSRTNVDSGGLSEALRKAVQSDTDTADTNGARARSAVMGVRGLDESKDMDFVGSTKPNLRMVFEMEERAVDKNTLKKLESEIQSEIETKISKNGP